MFVIGFFGYFIFQIACALSPNGASLLIFRFISGCFAACPLTNSGALLGDIWDPETRGTATALFVLSPFAGPAIGPIAGVCGIYTLFKTFLTITRAIFLSLAFPGDGSSGFLQSSSVFLFTISYNMLTFRQSGVCWLLTVFTIPETYGPVILKKKARALRASTGDQRYRAALELQEVSWRKTIGRILGRPWKIFFVEAMLIVITLYMSVSIVVIFYYVC